MKTTEVMAEAPRGDASCDVVGRRRRLTIRARVALLTGIAIVGAGGVSLALVYLFMRFAPWSVEVPGGAPDPEARPTYLGGPSVAPATADAQGRMPADAWIGPDGQAYVTQSQSWFDQVLQAVRPGLRGDLLDSLGIVAGIVLLLLALVAVAVSWLLAGRMLRPLREVARAVDDAGAMSLGKHIAQPGPDDEINDVARSFDGLADRLGQFVAAQRRFAANASHELTTPLATTRAMLDLALAEADASPGASGIGAVGAGGTEAAGAAGPDCGADRGLDRGPDRLPECGHDQGPDNGPDPDPHLVLVERELLADLRMLADRSLDTLDSLLALAEAQEVPVDREPVELSALAKQSVERLAGQAHDAGVAVVSEQASADAVVADGDPVLLALLVDNLVGNAIAHNAPSGTAWIRFGADMGGWLEVENTGPSLTGEQVERLTEPFYRPHGRSAGGGHGLGLAIVRAVATAHGATLLLKPRPAGGLRATVRFPPATNGARLVRLGATAPPI